MKNLEIMRRIVENRQYEKVDGVIIDLWSASAVTQVYDALGDENQAKYGTMIEKDVVKAANVAMKFVA